MHVSDAITLSEDIVFPNFLPVALSYFRGEETGPRALLTLKGTWLGMTDIIAREDFIGLDPVIDRMGLEKGSSVYIGPRATAQGSLSPEMPFLPPPVPGVGLIDVGIAFWHPDFRRPLGARDAVPLFKTMLFMEFEGAKAADQDGDPQEGAPKVTVLSEESIQDYCDLFDRKGQAAVVAKLGKKFPGSIYGQQRRFGGLGPHDFAHGTAMASAMFHEVGEVNAVGLELPAAAVLDQSGDTLRPVAAMAVDVVGKWIKTLTKDAGTQDQRRTHIAMPYAYLGGPAPGDNDKAAYRGPVHDALEAVLAPSPREDGGGGEVALYLPTGNLRQDRQHLRFGDMNTGRPRRLTWQLPAQDPTPNTIELCWEAGKKADEMPELTLGAPCGDLTPFTVQPNQVRTLSDDAGRVLGAAHLRAEGHWRILRLTLAATRASGDAPPARAGQWQLTVTPRARMRDVHGFILRDDPPFVAHQARRTRQSRFVDESYVRETTITRPMTRGPEQTTSPIKRDGTASHLVLGELTHRKAVSASERAQGVRGKRPSHYAGAFATGNAAAKVVVADVGPELMPGITALVSGGGAHGRVMGTSMAVARNVRDAVRQGTKGSAPNQKASSRPSTRSVSTG